VKNKKGEKKGSGKEQDKRKEIREK